VIFFALCNCLVAQGKPKVASEPRSHDTLCSQEGHPLLAFRATAVHDPSAPLPPRGTDGIIPGQEERASLLL
jgi:hypothetical protein